MENQSKTGSQRLGSAVAAAAGWTVRVETPPPVKCVIIGAHHTTWWDFPLTLLLMAVSGLRFRFVAKDVLFRGPVGWFLRQVGGIPVNRRAQNNFVDQMVELVRGEETCRLAIVPEGTRRKTRYWRTGFYYIALGAGVPIVMGYADYRLKVVGLGPILKPSGDIQADMAVIRRFYQDVTARYPDRQGDVQLVAEPDSPVDQDLSL